MLTKSLVLLSECFIPCPTGQTSKQTFAEELMVPCLRRKERLWEVKSEATLGQSVYCSLCVEGLQGKWSSLGRMWILNTAMEQNFVHFCLLFCLLSFLPASSFLPSTTGTPQQLILKQDKQIDADILWEGQNLFRTRDTITAQLQRIPFLSLKVLKPSQINYLNTPFAGGRTRESFLCLLNVTILKLTFLLYLFPYFLLDTYAFYCQLDDNRRGGDDKSWYLTKALQV